MNIRVSPRPGLPLHHQLRLQIEQMINSGGFPTGQPLPPEEAMGRELRVARGTVRRALADLVAQGILYRVSGRGTFVRQDALTGHRILVLSPVNHSVELHSDEALFRHLRMSLLASGDTAVLKPLSVETVEWMAHAPEIAGVLVYGADTSHQNLLRRLASLSLPSVILQANTPDLPLACVDLDNALAVREAVEYLRTLGHRRIGYVGAAPYAFDSRERFDAFAQVIRENSLMGKSKMIPNDHDWKLGVVDALQSWQGARFPTAILAGGFGLALHVLEALRNLQLSVPADVSLIGFDDAPAASFIQPPLTVLRQPREAMMREALAMLVAAIKNPQQWRPEKKLLPAELVVRASCAPVGGTATKIAASGTAMP